jgi:SAM-dependent methyltransferase
MRAYPDARDSPRGSYDPPVKRTATAALRNADPILAVLRAVLPRSGRVLELGSGTGEHAVRFAAAFPALEWQPSDPDPEARASIRAWAEEARLSNLRAPLAFDLRLAHWHAQPADAVLCLNVLHAAPPEGQALLARGAAAVLPRGGPLVVYGPFWLSSRTKAGEPPARAGGEGRRLTRIDGKLRSHDPALGVRERDAFVELCGSSGLLLEREVFMAPPDEGDLLLVFRRR